MLARSRRPPSQLPAPGGWPTLPRISTGNPPAIGYKSYNTAAAKVRFRFFGWPTLPAFARVGILTSFPEKSNPPNSRKPRRLEAPDMAPVRGTSGLRKKSVILSFRAERGICLRSRPKKRRRDSSLRIDRMFFLAFCAACTVRTHGMSCLMPGILVFSLARESAGFQPGPRAEFVPGEIFRRGGRTAFRLRRRSAIGSGLHVRNLPPCAPPPATKAAGAKKSRVFYWLCSRRLFLFRKGSC